ncbi:HU family DNA-binding protein, partial [Parablautia muri]
AEIGGITKKAAREGLELFIETLMNYMAEDEKVMIKGFGRFEMKNYKERICRSPIGGENCIIPEHKKMRFYASETIADRIKEMQGEEE